MTSYEFGFDCKIECLCEGDVALCPNIQAFGAAALKYFENNNEKLKPEVGQLNEEHNLFCVGLNEQGYYLFENN